ncbi:MAG: YlxR family protein [Bdellovibrionales bacterium]|nr:YlxR family protein [Bdellovibrionales bacterium]
MISEERNESQRQRVPERTCLGCRKREAQFRLVRLVLSEGAVKPQEDDRRTGRGAYIHPQEACLERLLRNRKSLRRAFRVEGGEVSVKALSDLLEEIRTRSGSDPRGENGEKKRTGGNKRVRL